MRKRAFKKKPSLEKTIMPGIFGKQAGEKASSGIWLHVWLIILENAWSWGCFGFEGDADGSGHFRISRQCHRRTIVGTDAASKWFWSSAISLVGWACCLGFPKSAYALHSVDITRSLIYSVMQNVGNARCMEVHSVSIWAVMVLGVCTMLRTDLCIRIASGKVQYCRAWSTSRHLKYGLLRSGMSRWSIASVPGWKNVYDLLSLSFSF